MSFFERYRTTYQPTLATTMQALVVFAAFALVLPISLISLSVALFAIVWLISGDYAGRWQRLRASQVAWSPLVLLALFAVGMFYSVANRDLGLYWLKKYDKLLLIPMLVVALREERWRQRAYYAYLIGIGMIVLLSFAAALDWWDKQDFPGQRNLLENKILYGALVAPAVYLAAMEAAAASGPRPRIAWTLYALAAAFGVFFVNTGRTGYIVMFGLLFLFCWQHWRWRGLMASVGLAAVLAGVLGIASPVYRERMDLIGEQMQAYETEGDRGTSVGLRLDYYTGALELIARHPVFGGGTGSYEKEYAEIAQRRGVTQFHDNPHNEFLFVTTQIGLVGLAALLTMLYWQWRNSERLGRRYRGVAQCAVVTFVVSGLFDSMLQDSVVGKFYVLMIGIAFSSFDSAADARSREGA